MQNEQIISRLAPFDILRTIKNPLTYRPSEYYQSTRPTNVMVRNIFFIENGHSVILQILGHFDPFLDPRNHKKLYGQRHGESLFLLFDQAAHREVPNDDDPHD
jgi:hypothetical protein